MARYYEETALIEFVNLYTPTISGETTMKCVERAIRAAPTANVAPIADTVKKMQERIAEAAFYEIFFHEERHLVNLDDIDQIAKEILEGSNEVQE